MITVLAVGAALGFLVAVLKAAASPPSSSIRQNINRRTKGY